MESGCRAVSPLVEGIEGRERERVSSHFVLCTVYCDSKEGSFSVECKSNSV